MVEASNSEIVATIAFALAIVHTFSVGLFRNLSHHYRSDSFIARLLHLLGEVEVVFGIWALVFCVYLILSQGNSNFVQFLEEQNFTEAAFVFVIMAISATRPILDFANFLVVGFSRVLPFPRKTSFYLSVLTLGPLLGSLITEPAAMTVTALILKKHIFDKPVSLKFKYATLGALFVNVSVGGTLTHFAAPPVLMVASKWGWDTWHMLSHFGLHAIFIVSLSSLFYAYYFRAEIAQADFGLREKAKVQAPPLLLLSHLMFLALVVLFAHHSVIFLALFIFFLGLVSITPNYQNELKLKEALLVGFFLAGLVILGGPQKWWLEDLIKSMNNYVLFFGAAGLTAVTDNAALTYLGAQVSGLSDLAKHLLVAGAVTGGGLTVIANAPNPAGYGILQECFGEDGIQPLRLFLAALIPTIFAAIVFLLLPSI